MKYRLSKTLNFTILIWSAFLVVLAIVDFVEATRVHIDYIKSVDNNANIYAAEIASNLKKEAVASYLGTSVLILLLPVLFLVIYGVIAFIKKSAEDSKMVSWLLLGTDIVMLIVVSVSMTITSLRINMGHSPATNRLRLVISITSFLILVFHIWNNVSMLRRFFYARSVPSVESAPHDKNPFAEDKFRKEHGRAMTEKDEAYIAMRKKLVVLAADLRSQKITSKEFEEKKLILIKEFEEKFNE